MKILIITAFICSFHYVSSQNLESHQWKNRVLLIFSKSNTSEAIEKQLTLIENNEKSFTELKLMTYQIMPTHYLYYSKKILANWIENKTLYHKYMTSDDNFKIVLIGLDGTIKHTQKTPITNKTLCDIINTMPMRQAELRKD